MPPNRPLWTLTPAFVTVLLVLAVPTATAEEDESCGKISRSSDPGPPGVYPTIGGNGGPTYVEVFISLGSTGIFISVDLTECLNPNDNGP